MPINALEKNIETPEPLWSAKTALILFKISLILFGICALFSEHYHQSIHRSVLLSQTAEVNQTRSKQVA